ncbi:MAG TPA: TlyA family RNA methyltransferase [Anaerolineales bacterium]|nr:TlyA family RNA methyltransferase [Anaerolineales bacterium]
MPKKRLDVLLVERGLAESRSQAQRLVMAGQVRVDGQVALKPASSVPSNAKLELALGPRYVSRGGEKLQAALDAFEIDPGDRLCADVGASTGGFTDCLLQRGARRVYAIDVGKGILHWKLRQDRRVVVMEETNARYLSELPEKVSLVTVDASFISLKVLLPALAGWLSPAGDLIALIKPQFEAGRRVTASGKGVIRQPDIHRQVLLEVLSFAAGEGLGLRGLLRSPLLGPKGNVEFLAWFSYPDQEGQDFSQLVEQVVPLDNAP